MEQSKDVITAKPVRASCSAGKAVNSLCDEDYSEYVTSVLDLTIPAKLIGNVLRDITGFKVRERMMQRHRKGDCACEYEDA